MKQIRLSGNQVEEGGQLADVILALSVHPQLEKLDLIRNAGRNECTALATLLQNTTQQLQTLNLCENNIDDYGVEALTDALSEGGSKLENLYLSYNQTITISGWQTVSALLEMPDSNLKKVILNHNNIGNEGAVIFANALRGNSTLEYLRLRGNGIGDDGWAHFATLLHAQSRPTGALNATTTAATHPRVSIRPLCRAP